MYFNSNFLPCSDLVYINFPEKPLGIKITKVGGCNFTTYYEEKDGYYYQTGDNITEKDPSKIKLDTSCVMNSYVSITPITHVRTNLDVYNKKPIGTIVYRKDANNRKRYLVKVDNKGTWEEAGRYFYKKYYGKIPKGHYIYFLDGNNTNFAKENLIALSKSIIGTLRARCVNDELNYFGQGILTEAMIEIIKTEKLINEKER